MQVATWYVKSLGASDKLITKWAEMERLNANIKYWQCSCVKNRKRTKNGLINFYIETIAYSSAIAIKSRIAR